MNRGPKTTRTWIIWALFMVLGCISTIMLDGVLSGKIYQRQPIEYVPPPRHAKAVKAWAAPRAPAAPLLAASPFQPRVPATTAAKPPKRAVSTSRKAAVKAKTAAAEKAARHRRLVIEWENSTRQKPAETVGSDPKNSRLIIEWQSSSGTARLP